jgi:thioredoxin-related protein
MVQKMKINFHKLMLATFITLCFMELSQAKDFNDSEVIHIEYPAWFSQDPFYDLSEGLEGALSSGKNGVMVLFTTEGCSYCSAFIEKSLGDPEIARVVQDNFHSVGMEIFDDVEMVDATGKSMSIKSFAKVEGAEYSPTLLFFGKDGQRVLRIIGYQSPKRFKVILDYIIGKHYQTTSLRDYFQSQENTESVVSIYAKLKEDSLFIKPPYALDRSRFPATQPLLVIFEKTGCGDCEAFHNDVLALEEVRERLGKFEVARLDANDETSGVLLPNGKHSTPASWFKKANFTRVPALMFFDEKGNNVLETDALVRRQRMMNSVNFVLERAYEKDWTYQRFARSKGIERSLKKQKEMKN